MADVKPLYLDANGVYRPVAGSDTAVFPNLKLSALTTADGVLSTNGSGAVSSAKLVNANVDAAAAIAYSKLALTGSVVNADISASAAIAYSKLALTGSIVNADIGASAAIAYSKLSLGSSIVNSDISGTAAIAYSKLNLSGSVVNADIATGAAIAYSKLNLGNSIVNNDVAAGAAIAYSKLNLTASIVDADIASGQNIAFYNAATPIFTNAVGVGTPTTGGHATTKTYVDTAINNAIAGLDYKQEARWNMNVDGFSIYVLMKAINGTLDFPTGAAGSVKTITDVSDNGSGLLKVTTSTAHGFTTGDKIRVRNVVHTGGTVNNLAYNVTSGTNFAWTITVVDADEFTLDGSSSTGFTYTSGGTASVCGLIPAESGLFTAGDRAVFNMGLSVETGIYVLSGSSGSWTYARSTDMAAGSDAAGAYVYAQSDYDVGAGTASDYQKAQVIQQAKGSAVVGTNSLSLAIYGVGSSYSFSAPLSESAGTVSLSINNDTLEVASSALKVSGLPSGFKINGSAVSSNVTKTNVDKLVDGTGGDASALHRHEVTLFPFVNASTQTVGKAVKVSAGNTVYASKTDGKVFGIIRSDAGTGQPVVAVSGAAQITAPTGSPSVNDNLYLNTSGDLCTYATLSSGDYATKVGVYLGTCGPGSTDMIAIAVQEFGIKP